MKPINDQSPLHTVLNLHRPQFPQFSLHGYVGLQIQGNTGLLLLLFESGDHGTGEPSTVPAECYVQQSGILVALVEYWQGPVQNSVPEFKPSLYSNFKFE